MTTKIKMLLNYWSFLLNPNSEKNGDSKTEPVDPMLEIFKNVNMPFEVSENGSLSRNFSEPTVLMKDCLIKASYLVNKK